MSQQVLRRPRTRKAKGLGRVRGLRLPAGALAAMLLLGGVAHASTPTEPPTPPTPPTPLIEPTVIDTGLLPGFGSGRSPWTLYSDGTMIWHGGTLNSLPGWMLALDNTAVTHIIIEGPIVATSVNSLFGGLAATNRFPNLRYIEGLYQIDTSAVTGTVSATFFGLTQLRSPLDLSAWNMSGISLVNFAGGAQNVPSLSIAGWQVNALAPAGLFTQMPGLTDLNLAVNTGGGVDAPGLFADLTSLRSLTLGRHSLFSPGYGTLGLVEPPDQLPYSGLWQNQRTGQILSRDRLEDMMSDGCHWVAPGCAWLEGTWVWHYTPVSTALTEAVDGVLNFALNRASSHTVTDDGRLSILVPNVVAGAVVEVDLPAGGWTYSYTRTINPTVTVTITAPVGYEIYQRNAVTVARRAIVTPTPTPTPTPEPTPAPEPSPNPTPPPGTTDTPDAPAGPPADSQPPVGAQPPGAAAPGGQTPGNRPPGSQAPGGQVVASPPDEGAADPDTPDDEDEPEPGPITPEEPGEPEEPTEPGGQVTAEQPGERTPLLVGMASTVAAGVSVTVVTMLMPVQPGNALITLTRAELAGRMYRSPAAVWKRRREREDD